MTYNDFLDSLNEVLPSPELSPLLEALWYDHKDKWDKAHAIIQNLSGADAAWIHAYLHRKDGDQWNAEYWYNRAERRPSAAPLDQEWEDITRYLCSRLG